MQTELVCQGSQCRVAIHDNIMHFKAFMLRIYAMAGRHHALYVGGQFETMNPSLAKCSALYAHQAQDCPLGGVVGHDDPRAGRVAT